MSKKPASGQTYIGSRRICLLRALLSAAIAPAGGTNTEHGALYAASANAKWTEFASRLESRASG